MPIGKFQSDVLRVLASQRSPDSYIAGGVAINREGPRYSDDIDIFHDTEARLESAALSDAAALATAGYDVAWGRVREGKREAMVSRGGESIPLEFGVWSLEFGVGFDAFPPITDCRPPFTVSLPHAQNPSLRLRWPAAPAKSSA